MRKQILVATDCKYFYGEVVKAITCFDRKGFYEVSMVDNTDKLLKKADSDKTFAVICDRYLLGYQMKALCESLFEKCKGIKIIFAFYEECPKQFAYRIYRNACDAAIPYLSGDINEFARKLVQVFDGHYYFTQEVWEGIKNREHLLNDAKLCGEISPRETDIITELCSGLGVKEIANKLNLSQSTVSTHLIHIRFKLGAKNSFEVIKIANEMGIAKEVNYR